MKRKAAFYIRLSDADAGVKKGCKDESNSISAQRELLYSYVRNHEEFADYEISEYFDDGISGTRFESRDSFVRMIDDAKAGMFECLLVKDFSRFGRDYLWDSSIINMITRNEAYTGVMIQNKCEVYGFGDNKRIRKRSREEWSVVEGGIPAIISRDLFERAKITCKPGRREQTSGKHKNLFECPYCGRKLRKTRYASKYVCPVRNMDKDRPCGRIMMPVEEAEKASLDTINESCRMLLSEREMADQKVNTEIDPAVRIKELKREQESLEHSVVRLYEAYKAAELSRAEYMARRERDKEREAELETEVQTLLNRSSTSKSDNQIETLQQCRDLAVFDPNVIEKVVRRILIYDDKRVEVVFAGDDFYQHAVDSKV